MPKISDVDASLDPELLAARAARVSKETDDEILERIRERFALLNEMTEEIVASRFRSMIVTGPPGVGKSHGVESVLNKHDIITKLSGAKPKYEVAKGTISSIGLFVKLHEFKERGCVLVLDDCDRPLYDEESLMLLKGALDSNDSRYINWNKDSRLLRAHDIPERFMFEGSVIVITNIKFDMVRSPKLRMHLKAIKDRCHYIDLEMDTNREKIIRIKDIVFNEGLLDKFGFEDKHLHEIVDFVETNQDQLDDLSLRSVIKIADWRRNSPMTWKIKARITCFRN
jgi:hypothetical protein